MGKQLVKIVKEICSEEGFDFKSYSDDYIMQITVNNKNNNNNNIYNKNNMFILGNKFPNNNASIEQICNDKSALSDLLENYNIPHVRHHYFLSPLVYSNNSSYSVFDESLKLLNKYNKLVCKVNRGTGGKNIYKVSNKSELENAILNIFSVTNSLTVSPYYEIEEEYRVLVLNKNVRYAFKKIRPFVTGDGVSPLYKLINELPNKSIITPNEDLDLNYIPKINEKVIISWKHNLGQGASPKLVNDEEIINLQNIAIKCANELDINFASIDIIKTTIEEKVNYLVLEINSGVMIESFSNYNLEYYNLAKESVREAIISYLKG